MAFIIFLKNFVWESVFQVKSQLQVSSHASVPTNSNYAYLWFLLLHVTKRFRFQGNKGVRFIFCNFSSERFT